MNRRQFVQQSAVAAVGTGGWMAGLRDLVERSRAQDRPVLTEESFNTFVRNLRARGSTATQDFVNAMRADVRKAVRDRFTLTSTQEQRLSAFTSTQISTIVGAVDRGFTGSNEFLVRLPTTAKDGPCGVVASRSPKQLDGGRTAEVWTVAFSQ